MYWVKICSFSNMSICLQFYLTLIVTICVIIQTLLFSTGGHGTCTPIWRVYDFLLGIEVSQKISHLARVWIELKLTFNCICVKISASHALFIAKFSLKLSLKLGPTALFTHLKIILLQYFQFSAITGIQTDLYSFFFLFFIRWIDMHNKILMIILIIRLRY